MALEVQVALIADHERPFEPGPISDAFYRQAYAGRPKVSLEVAEDASLATVLERAAETLGLQPPQGSWSGDEFSGAHRKAAFYKPDDDDGFADRAQGRMLLSELILVDRHGHAIFGVHDLRTVRYEHLIRSAAVGTIDGDPFRPYLIIDDGWGDAPPVDWATVQQGLDIAWDVVKAIGIVGGATAAVSKSGKWLTERLRRGREALATNSEWAQRGYRPDQFAALVAIRQWETADLASLLGCSKAEAEAVLWVMGYVFDEDDGCWRREGDDAAATFAQIIQAIGWASHARYDSWEPAFRQWLVRYLETGTAPALTALDPPEPEDEFADFGPRRGNASIERSPSFGVCAAASEPLEAGNQPGVCLVGIDSRLLSEGNGVRGDSGGPA